MGTYSPPELGGSTRAAAVAASRVVPREGILSSLQQVRVVRPSQLQTRRKVPMASYTIEIPDGLHHEIQERRHQIDVAGICTEALTAAVAQRPSTAGRFGHDVTDDINRMFSG